jgi:nucleoside 2-deoxyribosyltransferase
VKIYLAGPLFTEAERDFNIRLATRLEKLGHAVFLPQRDTPQDGGADRARRVFAADLHGLQGADAVVAVCDGALVDDGTAWEVGYAHARGIPIYGLRTDPRTVRPDERFNLMIEQSLRGLARSIDELVALLSPLKSPRLKPPRPGSRLRAES